jgi:hypothetical protein
LKEAKYEAVALEKYNGSPLIEAAKNADALIIRSDIDAEVLAATTARAGRTCRRRLRQRRRRPP